MMDHSNPSKDRAEQASSLDSEELYRLASLATHEAIWNWDLISNEVTWNEALVSELGHPEEARRSTAAWWYERIHPDDRDRVMQSIHLAIDGTTHHWQDHYRFKKGDGTFATVMDRGSIVRDADGRGQRMIGAMRDVSAETEAKAKLQESEANFRTLAEAIPQMLFVADLDGNITYYNNRWYEYIGHRSDETLGWGWHDAPIHHPDDLQRTIETWSEALRTGEPYQIEYRLRRHDGAYRWHLGRAVLMRAEDGTPIKWFGTNTDIHDQKTMADQLQRAVSAASLGFWDYRLEEGMVYWSEELRRHFGFPSGCYEGPLNVPMSRVHPDDRQRVQRSIETALAKQDRYHIEYRVIPKPGKVTWLECEGDCVVSPSGQSIGLVGTALDITEKRLAAEELLAAKEAAESASALKSAFLANMSHEIRTPLGAITGYAELLKDPNLDPAERQRFAETITKAGKALTTIIDDILDLSKVEAGRLTLVPVKFSLRELLKETLDLFTETAKQKGIDLRLLISDAVPAVIQSDPVRIRQIVVNLVGNAVKFTEKGGVEVRLEVESKVVAGAAFKLTVSDTGIGLDEEQARALFRPFTQVDSSATRKFGGTGLGLSLSQRLAGVLGGDIRLERGAIGQGATFAFRFTAQIDEQVEQSPAPSPPAQQPAPQALSGLSILVVEDSLDNQILVTRVLSRQGAEVDTASDGLEAVEKALAGSHDLVLMDIQMPKLDGYAATRTLRAKGYTKPIIALTAHAMVEEQQRTREAGCDAHLTKPLDFGLLIAAILKAREKAGSS